MTVGLVVVSHSASIATGVVDLAQQMAGDVRILAAGGTDDGSIGTSFEAISAAIVALADPGSGDGVVVLCDLGSAYLTTDTALEFLDDEIRALVDVSPAPLVEGTVAAAVAAQTGGDRAAVLAAAATAFRAPEGAPTVGDDTGGSAAAVEDDGARSDEGETTASVVVDLINESGLHARPAAEFVKTASRFSSTVRVNGTDAKSLLSIMAMALGRGASLRIEAEGPDSNAAVDALADLVRSGFGEV